MSEEGLDAVFISHPPNIFYLSGFTGTNGFLLITARKAFLLTDFRYMEQAREEAPFLETVKIEKGLDGEIILGLLAKEGISSLAVEEEYLSLAAFKKLQGQPGSGFEFQSAGTIIEKMRAVKEESEIESIASAAQIADLAFQELLPTIRPGLRESALACELEYLLRKKGSARIPFPIIVASGYRSALPHGVATGKLLQANELITIDFGAVHAGYCSDMTRTIMIGKPDLKQKKIFDLVCQAREIALQNLVIGMEAVKIDSLVRDYFSAEGYGDYFGHGLGHGIGLEVHERPSLSPRGQGRLEGGMVFSVEPGLYFPGWGGVRIEDLVVLRGDGPERLTHSSTCLSDA